MIPKLFFLFNALLLNSCVLAFKSDIPSTSNATSVEHNEKISSEEATGSSNAKLEFTDKYDFLRTSNEMYIVETDMSSSYILGIKKSGEDTINKFIVHCIFGDSLNKARYDFKNVTYISDIVNKIKSVIEKEDIYYAEHKITSMARRIFQRTIDFYIYNYKNFVENVLIWIEHKHMVVFLQELSNIFSSTNFNIRDYYVIIKERINNESEIKDSLDPVGIHNMASRIIQFVSDLIFVDSSGYSDLVQI
ncbi:hypothetical protein HEP_00138900 [Hepatocystis sp. ex Piliocolobus tephrosceles]|nr:hypothetical protein HEP_00138900 [Hepatocystis sp. ex Piliocolobus tephrosceles]